jgi:phosphohistidine phosphatase SixA
LKELRLLEFKSGVWLSSKYEHSIQTAQFLADGETVHPLKALTPKSPTGTLGHIVDETLTLKLDLKSQDVIAIVGHEPRLGQVFSRLTSKRIGPLGYAEPYALKDRGATSFEEMAD